MILESEFQQKAICEKEQRNLSIEMQVTIFFRIKEECKEEKKKLARQRTYLSEVWPLGSNVRNRTEESMYRDESLPTLLYEGGKEKMTREHEVTETNNDVP